MLIRVQGLVQGVGFRPFVCGLATRLGLCGWVRNTSAEVEILVQGQDAVIEHFLARLTKETPLLARLDAVIIEPEVSAEPARYTDFTILPSAEQPGQPRPVITVPPDAALCPNCEQDLLDPSNRRYLYPFTSCTDCGPRFTIIQDTPIDRKNTVMRAFPLCPACQAEYENPLDRRFHAQASACPVCGPRLALHEAGYAEHRRGEPMCSPSSTIGQTHRSAPTAPDTYDAGYRRGESLCSPSSTIGQTRRSAPTAPDTYDAGYRRGESLCSPSSTIGQTHRSAPTALESLLAARRLLRKGKILAIKGLGGFHLACDAENPAAVAELRRRKGRPDKPFAVMAADLEQISTICQVSEAEAALLRGAEKPIVLLNTRHRRGKPMCLPFHTGQTRRSAPTTEDGDHIAPHLDRLGCMLPYTPLHLLLLNQTDPILAREPAPALLVMTSGNRSGEPIITDNEEALARLAPLTDALLLHDRPIHSRCDDSVIRINSGKHPALFLRRSRGYSPCPIQLPFAVPPMLAVGGQLKNTFCLAEGTQAFLSQHIGDMEEAATCAAFAETVQQAGQLFRIRPEYIAHDLHPQYFTTRYARRSGLPCIAVQHHHAHIAACMADNGLADRQLIGLAFDGTGYGPDNTIWGGEVLIASYGQYERFAHLQYLPLPGGEAAIRQPWRIAVGAAYTLGIDSAELDELPFLDHIEPQALTIIRQQVDKQINCPLTSSLGRLFDATASLLNIRNQVSYEGQAAIELEVLSRPYLASAAPYAPYAPYSLSADTAERAAITVPLLELFRAMIEDIRRQEPAGLIGARLHHTIARLALDTCLQARAATGLQEAALSGGVWQNQILLDLVRKGLEEQGLTVYCHQQVPCNDGGLALGQLAVAHHRILNRILNSTRGVTPG